MLRYRVKNVVFTPKLSVQWFLMNLRKTDFVFPALACSGNILRKQAKAGKTKSVFLKIIKNHWTESLGVKTTFFTLYLSNFNPKEQVSTFEIDRFIAYYI